MRDIPEESEVQALLSKLNQALVAQDISKILSLFLEDCYWRDLVAFTWNIKTMEGNTAVGDMLSSQLAYAKPENFKLHFDREVSSENGVTSAWIPSKPLSLGVKGKFVSKKKKSGLCLPVWSN